MSRHGCRSSHSGTFQALVDRAVLAKQQPFHSDQVLVGPPPCAEDDFKRPRLRKCPFDIANISWICALGGGLDGYVWKVNFGDHGPFILKVFWDNAPGHDLHYWAIQRECQSAALLEMMTAAVDQAVDSFPIRIHAQPATRKDALTNLLAFSEDGRRKQRVKPGPSAIQISSVPRMKKCFGWLRIDGQQLNDLKNGGMGPEVIIVSKIRREIQSGQQYFAIVYEYISEGDNDIAAVQSTLDFFWRAGFDFTLSPKATNWTSGVLVDLADIVFPLGYGWNEFYYCRREAKDVLV